MWGTHVGPTEAKSLVSTGPRRRSYAGEVHRSERREFARSERRLFTRSDRRHVKDFVKRVGVHAKT